MGESCPVLVSVVVPVYNTNPADLSKCMESLSREHDSRLEIIAVDDGSDERTARLLDDVAAGCRNTVRVIHQANGGQSAARNRGVTEASGEYIEFVDSDDYVDWDAQRRVLNVLERRKPDIMEINVTEVTAAGDVIHGGRGGDGGYREVSKEDLLIECSAMWRQLVRRDLILSSGLMMYEGIHIGEDLASIACWLLLAGTTARLDADLYHFVHHDSSVTHAPHPEMIMDTAQALDHIISVAKGRGLYERYRDEIEYLAIKHVLFAGTVRALDWQGVRSPAIAELSEYMRRTFPRWRSNRYYAAIASHQLKYRLVLGGHHRWYLAVHRVNHRLRDARDRISSALRGHTGCGRDAARTFGNE